MRGSVCRDLAEVIGQSFTPQPDLSSTFFVPAHRPWSLKDYEKFREVRGELRKKIMDLKMRREKF